MVREMLYPILLVALAAFTLLDAVATVVGLKIGLIELNPLVMIWGVEFWVLFRILLLGGMLTVLFVGYRLCTKHFSRGVRILETILFMLDLYIGAVVVSGFLTIYMQLLS